MDGVDCDGALCGEDADPSPTTHLLDINEALIRELREEGKSDADIAESFLDNRSSLYYKRIII